MSPMRWCFRMPFISQRLRKLYEVRAVIVPDLYDTEKSVREIGDFLAPYLKINDIRVRDHCVSSHGGAEKNILIFRCRRRIIWQHLGKMLCDMKKGITCHVTLI